MSRKCFVNMKVIFHFPRSLTFACWDFMVYACENLLFAHQTNSKAFIQNELSCLSTLFGGKIRQQPKTPNFHRFLLAGKKKRCNSYTFVWYSYTRIIPSVGGNVFKKKERGRIYIDILGPAVDVSSVLISRTWGKSLTRRGTKMSKTIYWS